MEIRSNIMVPLGYGKYVRSDKIISLQPIEDDRGPGRRTLVHVEEVAGPITASRTESSILASMVETPKEVLEAMAAMELLRDILDDFQQIGPMLRRSMKKEVRLDIDAIEKRIVELIGGEPDADEKN